MTRDITMVEIFNSIMKKREENLNTRLPCIVNKVKGNKVDVKVIRNDDIDNILLIDVPIVMPETTSAYIYLGLSKGDRGVVDFCDKSIDTYKVDGTEEDNGDERNHSLNDGTFSLGFFPDSEAFAYPSDKTIQIGTKSGTFVLSVAPSGNLEITAPNVLITSPVSTIDGNVNITGGLAVGGVVSSYGGSTALSFNTPIESTEPINTSSDVSAGGISLTGHIHGGVQTGGGTTTGPE